MSTSTELVRQIHASGREFVLAVTGGGSGAISALLQVPGASRTVLEATVPYSAASLTDWLGAQPEKFCSERTARAMAMAAWQRARKLTAESSSDAQSLIGLACTASLASDRPKRGEHRAFLAAQTQTRTIAWSITFEKGRRTREEEEQLLAAIVLYLAAEICGLQDRLELELTEREGLEADECLAPAAWQDLLLGRDDALRLAAGGASGRGAEAARVEFAAIFPGAFNPLHHGHRQMAELSEERLNKPVEFEISIANVDKPPLDYLEIQQRISQFDAGQTVWLTNAATFVRKSQLFPAATFIVGADTIVRIADPRYYGDETAARDAAIAQIAAAGCRFLVFARAGAEGLRTLSNLDLPASLRQLCDEVPAEEFRDDISSTELRGREAGDL